MPLSGPKRTLHVVAATDEGYAIALAVMVRSLLENIDPQTRVDLFVLSENVSQTFRSKVEASWDGFDIKVVWIELASERFRGVLDSPGIGGRVATYARLVLADYLPDNVDRVIYLDCDLLVLGDISSLLDVPLSGALALAVPDAYGRALHIDRLACLDVSPWANFDARSAYFNAGVMVVDVAGWRREGISTQALELGRKHRRRLAFRDQDVLNVLLAGCWSAIDFTWNFHEVPQWLAAWEAPKLSRQELQELVRYPKVVHFITDDKPWNAVCYHAVHQGRFDGYLARTSFRDRKPAQVPWVKKMLLRDVVYPCLRLHWFWWRGVRLTVDRQLINRFWRELLRRPWLAALYPIWVLRNHLRRLN